MKAFQKALRNEKIDGKVIAVDQDKNSPALYVADDYYIEPVCENEADKYSIFYSECISRKVDAVIPTRNGELYDISQIEAEKFKIISSSSTSIMNCLNKQLFESVCIKNCIPIPKSFPSMLFAKPIWGAGSKGIAKIEYPDHILQEYVYWPEYTIDVFIHPNGTPISAVPRKRTKVINGESWVSETVHDDYLITASIDICHKFNLIWHNTVQCFYDGTNIKFIEINPRFGGGAALGFKAGHLTPQYIVRILAGREVNPCVWEYKDGITMMKYTEEIYR